MALLAEEEEGMRGMLRGLERYLLEKRLELNVKKIKLMKVKKGRRREKKEE